jgi:hypothetical protein
MTDKDKWGQMFGGEPAPTSKPTALVVNQPRKSTYRAFETQDRLLGFTVRCPSATLRCTFFYHHLLTIALNEPDNSVLLLTTNSSVITLRGQRLHALADAMTLHTVKSINEFSHELFTAPAPDDDQPYIEKIEIQLMKGAGGSPQEAGSHKREEV